MSRTKAWHLANKSGGQAYESGKGYKGVLRRGSKYGWKYEDGKLSHNRGGFDTPEEAAYDYDEFLINYIGPDADTNQALGLLKLKHVLEVREKIRAKDRPVNKAAKMDKRHEKVGAAGYRGVSKNASSKKKPFKAQTYANGKYVAIGTYETAVEAARAYDQFMLICQGNSAITNVTLGLLPPIGVNGKDWIPQERVKPAPEPEEILPPPVYRSPDEEREAQIAAARAMMDIDEEEEEGKEEVTTSAVQPAPVVEPSPAPESIDNVNHESDASFMGGVESAPAAISKSTELIVMSTADKLREQANALLRQAAEAEAGDIKRQAEERLNTLSATTANIQNAMMNLIDCCANIEIEIQLLRRLLK